MELLMTKTLYFLWICILTPFSFLLGNPLDDHEEENFEEEEQVCLLNKEYVFHAKGYVKAPTASNESWEAVQPFLLPFNHPVKKILDKIFKGCERPLLSSKNMKKAGFFNYTPSDKGIIVTGHPRLKGYLLKIYLDTCYLPEWKLWIQRIVGADQIRQSIIEFGYTPMMKAPKKWIYPLPNSQPPPEGEGYFPKHYVLVVQDMGILSEQANIQNWRHQATPALLDAFYNFVVVNGLIDSYFVDNSPFCFDKKIAFLDTEHYNVDLAHFPNRQYVLSQFLSPEMRNYWEQLIHNGGS